MATSGAGSKQPAGGRWPCDLKVNCDPILATLQARGCACGRACAPVSLAESVSRPRSQQTHRPHRPAPGTHTLLRERERDVTGKKKGDESRRGTRLYVGLARAGGGDTGGCWSEQSRTGIQAMHVYTLAAAAAAACVHSATWLVIVSATCRLPACPAGPAARLDQEGEKRARQPTPSLRPCLDLSFFKKFWHGSIFVFIW